MSHKRMRTTSFDRHITETTNKQSSDHTINGLHDQETSRTNNQATTMFQQTKHEVCQSSLQQLPQPLFEAICDCLDLGCKCLCLNVLNRSVRSMFRPNRCCTGPVTFTWKCKHELTNPQLPQPCRYSFGQLPYSQYARSITHDFDHECGCQSAAQRVLIQKETTKAIRGGKLEALHVIDRDCYATIVSLLTPDIVGGGLKNLRTLDISFDDAALDSDRHVFLRDVIDFAFLSSCVNLKVFKFRYCTRLGEWQLAGMVANFPPSVEEILLDSLESAEYVSKALTDNKLLPNLKQLLHLDRRWRYEPFDEVSRCDHNFLYPSICTVMAETGKGRPFEKLNLAYSQEWLSLDWCSISKSSFSGLD